MRPDPYQLLDALAANTGVTLSNGLATAPTVQEQIDTAVNAGVSTLAGRDNYLRMPDQYPGMRSEQLRQRVNALENLTNSLLAAQAALASGFGQQSTQLQVLNANVQLAQQASQTLQTTQAADELRLAALEAKATLTASATEANRLDIVALKAEDVLIETRLGKDETAIAAAQAAATQARTEAATAQKKADDDAAAVLVVQAQAKAAQDTATAAQTAVTTLANRFRSATVAVSAISGSLNATLDVVATWPAFPDTAYVAIAEPAGLALLGLDATEVTTARTASSATFRLKNVLGLAIAAGGALSVFAYRP